MEEAHRGSAGVRSALNGVADYLEVAEPRVDSRVEERGDSPGIGIDGSKVWALVSIAARAGEREIAQRIIATVLTGNDMLYVEGPTMIDAREKTVFAAVGCPFCHGRPD